MTLEEFTALYPNYSLRFAHVNEEGEYYGTSGSFFDALDLLSDFPNDSIVITLEYNGAITAFRNGGITS